MSVKTSYQPGEPIWFDLGTPDQAASHAFYGALLGWTSTQPSAQHGGYASYLLRDQLVAGSMPLAMPGQPPAWTCYVCTDDADKTTALVEQSGGVTLVAPMAVDDLGRMAVYADPAGAVFGVWEPGTHTGAQLTGENGTCTWIELTAEQPTQSAGFYQDVFGWEVSASDAYVEFKRAGTSVAGCTDPSQGTSGWLPYFEVEDPAAAAEQAVALGGSIVLPLTTFDGGSCTIVRDPHGAMLGLLHSGE